LTPERVLSDLLSASEKQSKEQVPADNLYRAIGFENDDSRLGWVNPPAWRDVEGVLRNFLNLRAGKGKTQFIFSGMGGSINAIKALNNTVKKESDIKIYTIDSLDPAAMARILSSIDDLSEILVVGISKSGTTEETLTLLSTLREKLQAQGLDYHDHFLWLTDLPQGRAKIENAGWAGVEILPIQTNGRTDIGGRFSAPHTTIFLIPLLLLLGKDMGRMKTLWSEYVQSRNRLFFEPTKKAHEFAEKDIRFFAIVLEKDLCALNTWAIQLFQESLGSKVNGFNPKTVVDLEELPDDFEPVDFQIASPEPVLRMMLRMYLLEVFVAVFAYYRGINFVTQPEVDVYKRKMKEASAQNIPRTEKVTERELVERTRGLLQSNVAKRFLEVICYWQLEEDERSHFSRFLRAAFPEKEILVFAGSDWNHHSYQAASKNDETFFLILIKDSYEQEIEGISDDTLQRNVRTLKTIAYATYSTLIHKSGFFKVLRTGTVQCENLG
jgi:hypothetical protein